MSDKIVICLEKGGQRDMAEAFARRTGYRIVEKQGEYLTVLFDSKGVSLSLIHISEPTRQFHLSRMPSSA